MVLDGALELDEGDGFDEVGVEAGAEGAVQVFLHAVAGEDDAGQLGQVLADLGHDINAGAIGQAEVGDEDVEIGARLDTFHCLGHGGGGGHVVAGAKEKPRKHGQGGGVVFHQQEFEPWRGFGQRGGAVRGDGLAHLHGGLAGAGQGDLEYGALLQAFAAGGDLTAVQLDNGA